jgi:hypothetical protein
MRRVKSLYQLLEKGCSGRSVSCAHTLWFVPGPVLLLTSTATIVNCSTVSTSLKWTLAAQAILASFGWDGPREHLLSRWQRDSSMRATHVYQRRHPFAKWSLYVPCSLQYFTRREKPRTLKNKHRERKARDLFHSAPISSERVWLQEVQRHVTVF